MLSLCQIVKLQVLPHHCHKHTLSGSFVGQSVEICVKIVEHCVFCAAVSGIALVLCRPSFHPCLQDPDLGRPRSSCRQLRPAHPPSSGLCLFVTDKQTCIWSGLDNNQGGVITNLPHCSPSYRRRIIGSYIEAKGGAKTTLKLPIIIPGHFVRSSELPLSLPDREVNTEENTIDFVSMCRAWHAGLAKPALEEQKKGKRGEKSIAPPVGSLRWHCYHTE
ncbi:hypothetical protein RRG08_058984 [Elysia crispata]|uniref:Uncharacterized protein n=1 Tax=Elysia crispata TaxID=231223 RepID=A0AAE1AY06_9GAST|nr:hypothetical protein RRG08_058984 [Elysia crispata]